MKLRIRKNSLRLRLTKSEVAQLGETGIIEETIEFVGNDSQQLIYALESADEIENPDAIFNGGRITVFIPKRQAEKWTQTNQIGIETEKLLDNGRTLHILIEKDFACLEPGRGEDDTDTFAHPLEKHLEKQTRLKAL